MVNHATYLFIDGAHLRKYYEETMRPWFGESLTWQDIDFNALRNRFQVQRCFFYDCLDNIKKRGETDSAFDDRVNNQKRAFYSMSQVYGLIVRLGYLAGASEEKKRQKEVDILLTVDMMNHAVRQNMDKAILLAGDRDFKPLVESLVNLGVIVELHGDRQHTSQDLSMAGDLYEPLTFGYYFEITKRHLQQAHPKPAAVAGIGLTPTLTLVSSGTLAGERCDFYEDKTKEEYVLFAPQYNGLNSLSITYTDKEIEKLRYFCKMQFGECKGILFQ